MKRHVFLPSLFFLTASLIGSACTGNQKSSQSKVKTVQASEEAEPDNRLDEITLPPGFSISYFARNIDGARSMTLSPAGVLYVGTRNTGKVFALKDVDANGKADSVFLLASGLNSPNGVAWKDGDLYVAEISRILRFQDIDNRLDGSVSPEVVYDNYPTDGHHGWKYIAFGPDEKLYVPVGAPCNICTSEDPIYATITSLDLATGNRTIVARGVRNTVGFDWHPETGELWFTDNGGDNLGDDMPACELNRLKEPGMHFGFPYCHQGDYPDPKLGTRGVCDKYVPPARKLGPHVAPLGMEFYTGNMFPDEYNHQIFIAEHGSWNRSVPIGYRVSLVRLDSDGNAMSYETFAEGWLEESGGRWGRPVDLELLPDGSMLVSDDYGDAIFRITYEEPVEE